MAAIMPVVPLGLCLEESALRFLHAFRQMIRPGWIMIRSGYFHPSFWIANFFRNGPF